MAYLYPSTRRFKTGSKSLKDESDSDTGLRRSGEIPKKKTTKYRKSAASRFAAAVWRQKKVNQTKRTPRFLCFVVCDHYLADVVVLVRRTHVIPIQVNQKVVQEQEKERGGQKGGGRGKGKDEEQEEEEPEELIDCRKAVARSTLHMALWTQMADGNHDMDLRRCASFQPWPRAQGYGVRPTSLLPEAPQIERTVEGVLPFTLPPRVRATHTGD